MTHGAYGVVWHRMAHASWEFVMSHGPWVMEKKSLNSVPLGHDPEGPGHDQPAYRGSQGAEELQRLFRKDRSGEGEVASDGPSHQ